jgi:hypothetical protein
MPSNKKMGESMRMIGIPDEIISRFDCADQKGNRPEPKIAFIDLMEKLLTKDQYLAVMEREGCCKGGQRDKDCKAFGKENKDKPFTEKLSLLSNVHYIMAPRLNGVGSITVTMQGHQNGVHTGRTTCSCGSIKKLKQPFSVSKTYCGCCAGHFLYHYQNALEVKLRLKEINSSPLDSNGEQPCSFTFEVI